MSELHTPRLRLRHWRASDLEPFAALNADPQVMEFMAGCLSSAESDALAQRAGAQVARQGFGLLTVSRNTCKRRLWQG
jgi:RimJ/RimL family protein N-acetyltransferase